MKLLTDLLPVAAAAGLTLLFGRYVGQACAEMLTGVPF